MWTPNSLAYTPCRFWGSCYDGTLILGSGSVNGLFAFCGRLDLEDMVQITDMEGTVYTYRVERIHRSKTASYETLSDPTYDLTLFVPESFSGGYIIVRCRLSV